MSPPSSGSKNKPSPIFNVILTDEISQQVRFIPLKAMGQQIFLGWLIEEQRLTSFKMLKAKRHIKVT
jgi:hypothetical protein